MAGDMAEEKYQMKVEDRSDSTVILFNNKKFQKKNLDERDFSDKDLATLQNRLEATLKFNVDVVTNCTVEKMIKKMKKVGKKDHKKAVCFIAAFLTYGHDGLVYGTDGPVSLYKLIEPLKGNNCPDLAGKPKIFILQTCPLLTPLPKPDGVEEKKTIPSDADFVFLWSTLPGSKFKKNDGSMFITALCDLLEENSDLEITKLMTRTIRQVEQWMEEGEASKQWLEQHEKLPYFVTQLTKSLYLKP